LTVVQMHGEPGSGKSTVARELGRRIGAIVLDKDVEKSALLRMGVSEELAGPASYEAFFAHARALVEQGQSIVLDCPVFWESIEVRWRELAAVAGSPAILIECVCADRDEIVRRLATREALESQPRAPLDPTPRPGSRPTAFQPRLALDTRRPLSELVDKAVAYVEYMVARREVAARS
jgi:predicted kinase